MRATEHKWRRPSAVRAGRTAWLAAALWTAYLVFTGAGLGLARLNGSNPIEGILYLGALGLPTVGALVAARRSSNAVGWILLALACSFPVQFLAREYATYSLLVRVEPLPFTDAAAWLAGWPWTVLLGLIAFLLLLFPDGRVPSRRWRLVAWSVVVAQAGLTTAVAFSPQTDGRIPNPLGLQYAEDALDALASVSFNLLAALILLAGISLIHRYRRSSTEQRLQIKWVAYAITLLAGTVVLDVVLVDTLTLFETQRFEQLGMVVLALVLPASVGIAISKRRLYEIDRLINRTLVYASVTVLLGLVYMTGVFIGGRLVNPVERESPLAVAASTLAVAVLFQPIRRWVQGLVDRHFNRRRYDANVITEAFSIRLRDQVDLNTLSAELMNVIGQTMQPVHASTWFRRTRTRP